MLNRKWTKAFRLFFAAALALAVCTFPAKAPAGAAQSGKAAMENLGVEIRPAQNGDVTVRQTWKVRLEDRGRPYRNLYFALSDDPDKADGISEPAVYDNDRKISYSYAGDVDPENVAGDEMAGKCYRHQSGGTTELGWFMPPVEAGVRTFTLTYTIRNLVHVYSDTAEIYLFVLPKNFGMPVERLQGTVFLPRGGKLGSSLWAWLHTDVRSSEIQKNTTDRVNFSAEGIPAETSVEIRVCAPTRLFPLSARKTSGAALSRIKGEEQRDADRAAEQANREYVLGVVDAAGAVAALVGSLLLFFWARRKNRRIRVEVGEYTRDIPPGNSPAGVANLYYFYRGGLGEKEKNRALSATLLSLARKGYVRFRNTGRDFAVESVEKEGKGPLSESETVFYQMISGAAAEFQNSFTMKQFRQYAEAHCRSVSRSMEEFWAASQREITGRGYFRERPAGYGALKFAGVALFVAAAALFMVTGAQGALMVYLPLSLVAGGILLLAAGSAKMKLTEKGERDLAVWNGLRKYMFEFSRMTEYGVPQLSLWEEYLVYATMMGISKEVCAQLKLVYPQLSGDAVPDFDPAAGFLYYMFWPHYFGGGFLRGGGFGESLGISLGDIGRAATRLAHPPANGGGFGNGGFGGFGGGGFGGGGFSGGGGGFGGGGGGGVR